jgi:hypothetical protein
MGELIALLQGGNLALIIIILLVTLPAIARFIEWVIKIV